MAADLRTIRLDQPIPPDFRIEQVGDGDTLTDFERGHSAVYNMPLSETEATFNSVLAGGFDPSFPQLLYVGYFRGAPVTTSMMFLGAGVAGIYAVATVPEARKHGFGAAMTLAPLRRASELGCRIGILTASEMGLSIYRRIGFRDYCKMSFFEFSATSTSKPMRS